MCVTKILSIKAATTITYCPGCNAFYILHNNLLLSFTKETFNSFQEELRHLSLEQNGLLFPGGLERIILRTPNPDISFSFGKEEFVLFKHTVDEAVYMREIYTLIP